MRIAILFDDYVPHSTRSGSRMLHELALEFVSLGHNVVVITPGSHSQKDLLEYDEFSGVQVWRFKSGPVKGISKFKRAINESILSWSAIRAIKSSSSSHDFDICINYSPTIFFGPLASWLRKSGAFVYLILRDFFPQWVIDQGMLSKYSLITKYFRLFEAVNYKSADILAVQSPANVSRFLKMTPFKHSAIRVLHNWYSVGCVNKEQGFGCSLINEKKISQKVLFFYGGNIGLAQDMSNIIRLAKRLENNSHAHFLLVGQGDEFNRIKKLIDEKFLINVSIHPSVTQEQYISILDVVDVGIFSLAKNHSAHNYPGKVLGYMAASLPILGSVNEGNDLMQLINDSSAGLITVNGNDDEFYNNAIELLNSESSRSCRGVKAQELLTDVFSVRKAAEDILNAYNS